MILTIWFLWFCSLRVTLGVDLQLGQLTRKAKNPSFHQCKMLLGFKHSAHLNPILAMGTHLLSVQCNTAIYG